METNATGEASIVALRRVASTLIEGNYTDETEGDRLIAWFNEHCPHPDGSDLIFWPKVGREPTVDAVVKQAMSYEPGRLTTG